MPSDLFPSTPFQASDAAAIASALWDSADFDGAALHYERALQQHPSDWEALFGLGRLRLARNDLGAAAALLEQAQALALSVAAASRTELLYRVQRELAWCFVRLDRLDLAAPLLAALPGQEALAAQAAAFGETPPYRLGPEVEEIELPFLGTDPLPIVGVTLGNRELPFVLDTGSAQVTVDSGLLREEGLAHFGTGTARFASGQQGMVAYTRLPRLLLGTTPIADVPAEVLDIRRVAPQLNGLLGTQFLQHFHVLCDWKGATLRLRPRRVAPFPVFREMVAVPFLLLDSHLMVARAHVNEHRTMAFLASGMAGGAFSVPDSTMQQACLQPDEAALEGLSGAGISTLHEVRAPSLCLGEWCRTDVKGLGGFFPSELEWRYGFRVGALVSHAFLKGQQWGIDWNRMEMYFA